MPAWYDILGFSDLSRGDQHDQTGILKSRDYFNTLIQSEISAGIPSTRILLGGFSQGGAISLFTGLTTPYPLAGIVGLSSYLLLQHKVAEDVKSDAANKNTSVFMGHGDADPLVRTEWGRETAEILKGMGWKVDFRVYKGLAHGADPKEIDDLEGFIAARLPAVGG